MKVIVLIAACFCVLPASAQEQKTPEQFAGELEQKLERSMDQLEIQDSLLKRYYHQVLQYASDFRNTLEEYKWQEIPYTTGLFKLGVLGQDTSVYTFRFLDDKMKEAVRLRDSLQLIKSLSMNFKYKRLRDDFIAVRGLKDEDLSFKIEQYQRLYRIVDRQLRTGKRFIVEDTAYQAALLRENEKRIKVLYTQNKLASHQVMEALTKLQKEYAENSNKTFPASYDRYFQAYREDYLYSLHHPKTGDMSIVRFDEVVDEPADFPGGVAAFKSYILQHCANLEDLKKRGSGQKVGVKFGISRYGKVSDVFIMNGITACHSCDAEIKRCIEESPDWFPAKSKGETVNAYFSLSIEF